MYIYVYIYIRKNPMFEDLYWEIWDIWDLNIYALNPMDMVETLVVL